MEVQCKYCFRLSFSFHLEKGSCVEINNSNFSSSIFERKALFYIYVNEIKCLFSQQLDIHNCIFMFLHFACFSSSCLRVWTIKIRETNNIKISAQLKCFREHLDYEELSKR